MGKFFAAVLIICAMLKCGNSKNGDYRGHQVWRVTPESSGVLQAMKDLKKDFQLDFWTEPRAVGRSVDFRVPRNRVDDVTEYMKSRDVFGYRVFISDLGKLIEDQTQSHRARAFSRRSEVNERRVSEFDYSSYHPAEEVYDWMDMVTDEYEFAAKQQIGVTYEGRAMYSLSFKKGDSSTPKPVFIVDALIHCREWITTASLMYIFKEMLQNAELAHMMEDADWYFVPMINIDGYVETWKGDRLWRKTRSTGASSACSGIDANRNWDAYWAHQPGSSPDPCAINFHGPTPESELEIRHLASYVAGFGEGNVDAYVSTHSYSQLILYPYNYDNVPSAHDKLLHSTGQMISEAMYSVHGTEYVYGRGSVALYPFSGTTTDWTYDVAKVNLSFTFELRDTGKYGFLLPADQIIPTAEEYLAGLKALKNYVVENFEKVSTVEY